MIAIGSNLRTSVGGPTQTIGYALKNMASKGLTLRRVSRFYNTPSFPDPSDPPFVNAVVHIETERAAQAVLRALHEIEAAALRTRDVRWGARSLDLDLLSYDDLILPNAAGYAHWRDLPLTEQTRQAPQELILPHPRIAERGFVLVPLRDVAHGWHHPASGQTCEQMLENLDKARIDEVIPLESSLHDPHI